jgi:hypothetical protein
MVCEIHELHDRRVVIDYFYAVILRVKLALHCYWIYPFSMY